ncbi:hypothetical protein Harman_32990 [Haloarcula mannanilytica]|uniref:Uncharacterized protein n=1 Tax=Haloarcula mannanilytica TaxID=2509225 RepID=A0A4C2ELD9_9EURY|nr:hypothetical protein Harman_32990 [Haloarcula mannanilytica]
MTDDTSRTRNQGPDPELSHSSSATATGTGQSRMQARTWVIAAQYNDPEDYGIPTLPKWTVLQSESSGIAFAENPESDPFIRSEQPMKVRR